MPIFIIKDWPIIASKSEFLSEYSKLPAINNGEELNTACQIMLDLDKKRELNTKDKSDWEMNRYNFSYSENEAKEVVVELLLFHSYFYGGFELYDWNDKKIDISDFVRSFHLKDDQFTRLKIVLNDLSIELSLADIKRIQGVVNNFVIETEKLLYFFSSTIYIKKRIRIVLNTFNDVSSKSANGASYIFDSNRPNKNKLRKFRTHDCLLIMSY